MTLMFHESPYGGLTDFEHTKFLPVFFTREERVAREYAFGTYMPAAHRDPGTGGVKKPTIYRVEVNGVTPYDMRKNEHLESYKTWRKEFIQAAMAVDLDDDEVYHDYPPADSEGFIQSPHQLPNYASVRRLWKMLEEKASGKFDSIMISEGSQGISLALFKPQGKTKILSTVHEGRVPPMHAVFGT